MSKRGMIVTVLATGLSKAVEADEANEDGFDLSAGMFGINVSNWIREVALEIPDSLKVVVTERAMQEDENERPHKGKQ